jgi:hypothetical protein
MVKLVTESDTVKRYFQVIFVYLLPALLWAFQIFILIYWWAEPVFYVPEQWFGPITDWLKFPFAPIGSCGIFYWWTAIKSILGRSKMLYSAAKNMSLAVK